MATQHDEHDADEGDPHDDPVDPMAILASAAELVVEQARQHPYRTLGIAFGSGYVLGGGVPRFVVRIATMAALRSLGHAILTSDAAAELGRSVLAGRTQPPREPHGQKRNRGGRFTA
jgi:hypothetical protein